MTHTPGPWEYDDGVQIVEAARPHMRICFLPSDHHEYASSKPNARLIAAAPEMLVALQEAQQWLTGTSVAYSKVRAAIAKATGAQS